jgi:hypothetical protein
MQTFHSEVKFTDQAEMNLIKINGGQFLQRVKYAQVSINFGTITGHETVTQTATFSGATVGKVNFVQVKQPSGIDEAVIFCAGVSADDTVTIRAHNTKNTSATVATATFDMLLNQFND